MSSVAPKFADGTVRANPLAWSAQLTVPDPIVQGAYPIAGFTDFGYYQCYASASDLSGICLREIPLASLTLGLWPTSSPGRASLRFRAPLRI